MRFIVRGIPQVLPKQEGLYIKRGRSAEPFFVWRGQVQQNVVCMQATRVQDG